MISHEHRAIFIHIQKTGGNSVSAALGKSFAEPDKHWTAAELRRTSDGAVWDSYYKFSFVRNPWARLVSWYAMIDRHRPAFERGQKFNRFQTAVLSRARSFPDFVARMDEEFADADGLKWIYRNQVDYLTGDQGELIVDFVGRTERMAEDFAEVSRHLAKPPAVLERLNASEHAHYASYYSADLAELVAERYSRDIARFGFVFGE